jgi:hypothetical protein
MVSTVEGFLVDKIDFFMFVIGKNYILKMIDFLIDGLFDSSVSKNNKLWDLIK